MRSKSASTVYDEINAYSRAFDAAVRRRDTRAAESHGELLIQLIRQMLTADADTLWDAAVLLREAALTLEDSEDQRAPVVYVRLRRIARRLARGERRLTDLVLLRTLAEMARDWFPTDDTAELTENAIRAAARPQELAPAGC